MEAVNLDFGATSSARCTGLIAILGQAIAFNLI